MVARQNTIEDSYPLSPLQEGLLFHGLCAPEAGYYVTQVTCTLTGLDVNAFERAWRRILDRHAILRTAFVYRNLTRPLQVVGADVGVHVVQHDLRALPAAERERRWCDFLDEDRGRG
ncbi:MAG: non-ribosomal peptide synthetase, partial [Gammaproteobacteria bacterium]|nr:non-ribosomal peptide synthetase [Gammaproteobacteria bacterium]